MSFKRRVLSALGKDVLLEISRGLELDVTTRMGVEELRDALAKSGGQAVVERRHLGVPPDQSPVEFLLALNQLVAEDEQQGRKVRGPGLPDHLDPKDQRWFSTDCIEPLPVGS
jgi:hypothetical protein